MPSAPVATTVAAPGNAVACVTVTVADGSADVAATVGVALPSGSTTS